MFAIGLFILGNANEAQATSGGCFMPSFATNMLLQDAPDDFVSSQKRCREQCGKIHSTCRRVANSAATCLRSLFKGESGFEGISCTEEENVRECRAGVRDNYSDAPAFIREDLVFATDDCADARRSCRDSCSGDT
jgi:hypothetical protein